MQFRNLLGVLAVWAGIIQLAPSSRGFALLGPFAPWMAETNGLRQKDIFDSSSGWQHSDIGGPMRINSEYRWNVPIVTYEFDQSFIKYFGESGITAVEQAVQILNDLPAASDIVLTNYPLDSRGVNYFAQTQGLYDLKSVTLSLLLEQMGLAQPVRYTYVLSGWDPSLFKYQAGYFNVEFHVLLESNLFCLIEDDPFGMDPGWHAIDFLDVRNIDPETLAVSPYVNGTPYNAWISSALSGAPWPSFQGGNRVLPFVYDPFDHINTQSAVADAHFIPGQFYTRLTRDDVGGLRYLLSADNVNFEKLLPDVRTTGPRRMGRGNGAWRPGVEKIAFVRHSTDRWGKRFRPMKYHFADFYLRDDVLKQERAEREIRHPDFLFCVADTAENNPETQWVVRTTTTNWLNNALINGNTNGEGPGVIKPPIKITFHKLGVSVSSDELGEPGVICNQAWGSFDDSTNLPVAYPRRHKGENTPLTVHFSFYDDINYLPLALVTNQTWNVPVPIGSPVSLQVSTNQVDWTPHATVTNVGTVVQWDYFGVENPPKFFRAIPQ
jgi:hypothetical protein